MGTPKKSSITCLLPTTPGFREGLEYLQMGLFPQVQFSSQRVFALELRFFSIDLLQFARSG